jgi:regulator of CtrA degradation
LLTVASPLRHGTKSVVFLHRNAFSVCVLINARLRGADLLIACHRGIGFIGADMALAEADDYRGLNLSTFTSSALFEKTFDEGMALVEETARYLDGRGRQESRDLPRKAATLYAGESMRVTTRLMQAASWLLVQRAVQEGDMKAEDAATDRYRLGSKEICLAERAEGIELLPAKLQELLDRSDNLYRRIARLDDVLFGNAEAPAGVQAHFTALEKAFGTDGR